jgi:hypothetical protein
MQEGVSDILVFPSKMVQGLSKSELQNMAKSVGCWREDNWIWSNYVARKLEDLPKFGGEIVKNVARN